MTQVERIVKYMNDFGAITALDAMKDIGVMRLASRISDMRDMGYKIIRENVVVTNRYGEKTYIARYRLEDKTCLSGSSVSLLE